MLPKAITSGYECFGTYFNDDGERQDNWQNYINRYDFNFTVTDDKIVMVITSSGTRINANDDIGGIYMYNPF